MITENIHKQIYICIVHLEARCEIFCHKLLASSFFIFINFNWLFIENKALEYKINSVSSSNISSWISIIKIEMFHVGKYNFKVQKEKHSSENA